MVLSVRLLFLTCSASQLTLNTTMFSISPFVFMFNVPGLTSRGLDDLGVLVPEFCPLSPPLKLLRRFGIMRTMTGYDSVSILAWIVTFVGCRLPLMYQYSELLDGTLVTRVGT